MSEEDIKAHNRKQIRKAFIDTAFKAAFIVYMIAAAAMFISLAVSQ